MKKKWRYPTAFSCWGDEERQAIERVIDSDQFTMAGEVAAFEREFADFHGRRYGIMVNSGSSANLIAVAALFNREDQPLKRGQQVVVPALAWSTTYAPLVQHGMDLILADCDSTWNVDIYSNRFYPDKARLFVGCSILGNPADLVGMATAAGVMGADMIEDNCESLGASINDRLCGTHGIMSTFSFFHSHQISAIEGGMILTDDDEMAVLCRMLRVHGWSRDVVVPETFDQEYDFRLFGYNVRPLEMHAAIAREQLRKLPAFIEARRANLATFWNLAEGLPITQPSFTGDPSPFGIHFTLKSREARQKVVAALRGRGIDCRLPTGGSLRMHPYGARWEAQETPWADVVHRCGLFIGNGPVNLSGLIEEAVETIGEALR